MIDITFTIDNVIQSSLGGGLIQVMKYAKLLKSRGVRLKWLTMESDVTPEFEEQWGVKVRSVQLPDHLSASAKRDLLLREAFAEAAGHPRGRRIVSTDSAGITADAIRSIWKGRLGGIPSFHNTSMYPGPVPDRGLGALKLKAMARLFLEGHAALVSQTQITRRFFADYAGFNGSRSRVISNGVDCTRFSPASPDQRQAIRRRLGLADDAPIVLNVGSIIPRKGQHLLLQAWPEILRLHPSARLVLAGTLGRRATFGDAASTLDDYARQILAAIEALPDPGSVILTTGQVDDVESYCKAADVFAFTSEREGLPNAVLEAMACGLPCVLAPYAGICDDGEELGVHGEHFIRTVHKPAPLAASILDLIGNPDRLRSIGTSARQWMLRTQDLPTIVEQWAALYEEIAAAPPPRSK